MAENHSFKKEVNQERQKLKEMSWQDRLWYIWEYYKFHIIALVIVVGLGAGIVSAVRSNRFDTLLYCAVINNKNPDASMEDLETGFWEYCGSPADSRVTADNSLQMDLENTTEFGYASMAKLSALITDKDLDVIIADAAVIDHYGSMGGLLNPEEVLSPELSSRLREEQRFYLVTTEDGTTYPGAISLADTDFLENSGIYMERPMIAIISNSLRTDTSAMLISYLFEETP